MYERLPDVRESDREEGHFTPREEGVQLKKRRGWEGTKRIRKGLWGRFRPRGVVGFSGGAKD